MRIMVLGGTRFVGRAVVDELLWAEQILAAAGAAPQLVRVADDLLPDDLELTGDDVAQHWLVDSTRARDG